MSSIKNMSIVLKDGRHTLSADFESNGETTSLWFSTDHDINPVADVFVASTMVPSMRIGQPLDCGYPISPRLMGSLEKIQDIMATWYPKELSRIKVGARPDTSRKPSGSAKKTACFFSGGVDSFYTLIKHQEEIDAIVYVHGFDLWLHETEFRKMVSERLRKIAAELGKELIEVETNLLDFSHKICDWQTHYHGSALASVGILLSKEIGKIYVPSSFHKDVLFPWASHPDLDELWSTEDVEIVHDGCEATRLDKVKFIGRHQIALDHLRVCLDRRAGLYNCSCCEKCIRTMISLHIAGMLDKSNTFVRQLTKFNISNGKIRSHSSLLFALENQRELVEEDLKMALTDNILEYQKS